MTNAEFMGAIRKVARAPFGLPAPRWLLELGAFFLRTETELVLKSRRVVAGKLQARGFTFRHPHLLPAIEQLVAQLSWRIVRGPGLVARRHSLRAFRTSLALRRPRERVMWRSRSANP